jgi:prepilin signal peptidase PulO-like enzyme (type II secretory pathway)
MLLLIFIQKFKRRKIAPMAPAMFIAVVVAELLTKYQIYPF